jgi:hypothetical protein
MPDYDSTGDTLKHSLRVGALMGHAITELVDRSVRHDHSKTQPPELEVFDRVTPQLRGLTYGTDEYKAALADMGDGLAHHYAVNRHHPEHFADGVNNMTLVDLLEVLADWKAATERHTTGSLAASLTVQRERFGLSDQLVQVLRNTAAYFGWLDGIRQPQCGVLGKAPNGDRLDCTLRAGPHEEHCDGARDNLWWRDGGTARV